MSAYIEYLDRSIARLEVERLELQEGLRQDEADFAKIRINIHAIARTVYESFSLGRGGSLADYPAKLASLRLGWQAAGEMAAQHGDVKTAVIEGIKAETMNEIELHYQMAGGE